VRIMGGGEKPNSGGFVGTKEKTQTTLRAIEKNPVNRGGKERRSREREKGHRTQPKLGCQKGKKKKGGKKKKLLHENGLKARGSGTTALRSGSSDVGKKKKLTQTSFRREKRQLRALEGEVRSNPHSWEESWTTVSPAVQGGEGKNGALAPTKKKHERVFWLEK